MSQLKHIIVTGNLGTGKTSVAYELSHLIRNSTLFLEKKGAFVRNFYVDRFSYAFLNQLDYTIQLLERLPKISSCSDIVVEDRSMYDTHCVFTKIQLKAHTISEEQHSILDRLYRIAISLLRPTLLALLDCPAIVSHARIIKRGDPEEEFVTKEYLEELRSEYRNWFNKFDLCKKILIDVDNLTPKNVAKIIMKNI